MCKNFYKHCRSQKNRISFFHFPVNFSRVVGMSMSVMSRKCTAQYFAKKSKSVRLLLLIFFQMHTHPYDQEIIQVNFRNPKTFHKNYVRFLIFPLEN